MRNLALAMNRSSQTERLTATRSPMLQIDNLVFNAWGRRFFDRATVTLPLAAKVGLVGRNGAGKSTLFKLILGELGADGGDIAIPRGARVATVAQEHPATPVTLLDTILEADEQRNALYAELETASPSGSPTSTRGWRRSTPTAPRPARARSWPGWASPRPTWAGRWPSSPAAGACAWRWPRLCSPSRTCCCSTNRPTISISRAPCGSRRGCANTRTRR